MKNDLIPGEQPLWEEGDGMPKQRSVAELTFKYEGDAVADGTMDMADFGRALIGYTTVVNTVINQLSPQARVTDVRFNNTQKGSFVIMASVVQDVSVVRAILDFFNQPDQTAIATMIGISGGLATVIGGAVKFAKKLHGRRIVKREPAADGSGDDIVTMPDGNTIQAAPIYIDLSQNYSFNIGMQDVLGPVKTQGVDALKMPTAGGESIDLREEDAASFVPRVAGEVDVMIDKLATLEVERVAFDGGKWRFTQIFDDDSIPASLTAAVEDDDFLRSVENSVTSFKAKDRILATLETTVSRPHGKRAVYSYVVSKVHKVLPYEPPQTLPGL